MSGTDPPHREFLHRMNWRKNRSNLPRTGPEESDQEHMRSQTPSPQSKHGLLNKLKEKVKKTFRAHNPVHPEENEPEAIINQPSSSLPAIVVNAPQDEISSNQETPSDQLNVPDPATDAARELEAASTDFSKINVISVPSKISNAIGLVGSVPLFVDTLSQFNGIMDKIGMIHPYAQVACTVLSFVPKTIIAQTSRDDSVCSLLSKMDEVYTFLIHADLQDIKSMKTVIDSVYHQTLECSYFIREYSQNEKFRMRLLKNLISDTDSRVKDYSDAFDKLLQQFRDRAAGDTLVVVHRIWKDIEAQVEASDLNSMPYVGGAGLDTRKICLEGTRKEILDEITTWINNTEDSTRVFWLHGEAGTGKSSIAHTIAHRFKNLKRLGSCYCFNRNEMAEQRHKNIFTTIAQDLADHDQQIRTELAAAVHLNKSLKHTTDILQQWTELIMKPARTLSEAMVGPIVIIIDALDESGGVSSRQHLLRILTGTGNPDDESHISKLPSHIRILLASRPLPDICNALDGVKHVQSKSMGSIPSNLTQRDIHRYVSCELYGIHEVSTTSLASASDGLFEWARLACAFVKGDNDPGLTAKERLEVVITQDKHMPLLDGMYKLTLNAIFPSDLFMRSTSLDRFRSVMAQILGTAEPLPLTALSSMRDHFIDERRRVTVNTIIKPLGALLSGTIDPSITVRPLHASFREFLTEENRSGEFFIDFSHIHNDLVSASLGVMKDELQFDICQLPTSYLPNSEIHDIAQRVKDHISPALSYSCRFWAYHLEHTEFNLSLAQAIREFFTDEQFLFWLEALSLLEKINICAGLLTSVITWIGSHAEHQDISDDAADAQKFIRMFGHTISLSTPHLYLSALPFSPKNSHISKRFTDKFHKVLQIISGHNMTWPAMQIVLHGHSGLVISGMFSPDGKHMVSGSYDKTICLWDAETGKLLHSPLLGHKDCVCSVAFSPDGKHIVSGSYDSTICMWDVETGQQLQAPLQGHKDTVWCVAFSPDGKHIVSGSADKTIRFWDAKTGKLQQLSLQGHGYDVHSVAFSPDGKYIVSGSADKTIRLWNAKTGELLQPPLQGHKDSVFSVAFSSDGKHIVSGSADNTICLWNAETGELLQPPLHGHEDIVWCVAFSPDGKYIVSGSADKTIQLWNAETRELLQQPLKGHRESIIFVTFSPDGKRVMSGSHDKTIRLWDIDKALSQLPLEGHEDLVMSVAFLPDSKHIVSGSFDQTIQLWHAMTGKLLQLPLKGHQGPVWSIALSPNGKCIVSGSSDKTICLWNAETGKLLQSLHGHEDDVWCVAFSPDGKHIVSGSADKTIRLWNAETGKLLQPPLQSHKDIVYSVAFSPDGKYIASGSRDMTICLWDTETRKLLQPPLCGHTDAVHSVVFSPDGKQLVSGSSDETIQLWNAETGKLLQPPLQGHESTVFSVAFSPNGKQIVSGSADMTIWLWDANTGELLQPPLQGHDGYVRSVAFSPDGKSIVSGSDDRTIRLWNAEMEKLPLEQSNLICFSSHPEHALINTPELVEEITAGPGLAYLVDMTDMGWVCFGPKHKLLFHAPSTYHPRWHPNPGMQPLQLIIPAPDVQLDLSSMAHGSSWNVCYKKTQK